MKAKSMFSCRIMIILFGVLGFFWYAQDAHPDWTFAVLGGTRGNQETTNGKAYCFQSLEVLCELVCNS